MRRIVKYIAIVIFIAFFILGLFLWKNSDKYYTFLLDGSADIGFNVQEIDLYGRVNTSIDSVMNIIGIERDFPIFGVDIKEMQTRLEKLAWVRKAIVRRIVPDKIVVEIQEHLPLAIWQNDKKYYVISTEGKVLKVSAEKFDDLPIVIGTYAPIETPLILSYVDTHFPEIKPRIKSLVKEGDRRWNLILDDLNNGLEIKLPEEGPNIALQELASINEESSILEKEVSLIDLRIPDKIMIKFQKNPKIKN